LNDFLKYNANTNKAIRGKGTKLIHSSSFEQFDPRVGKNLPNLVLDGLKYFVKQTKACKTRLKKPQNGIRLNLKPTPRSKKNRTSENHKKRGHLQ
jgi:hypothetical protein